MAFFRLRKNRGTSDPFRTRNESNRSFKAPLIAVAMVASLLLASLAVPVLGGPKTRSAANVLSTAKRALKIARAADKRSKQALKQTGARRAQGAQGPQGAQGAQGAQSPQGPAGASATKLWAVIETSNPPRIVRGSGAVSVWRASVLFNGMLYYVSFNQNIVGCAYVATIGDVGDGTAPPNMFATVEQRDNNSHPNDLILRAFDTTTSGTTSDPGDTNGFHVAVFC